MLAQEDLEFHREAPREYDTGVKKKDGGAGEEPQDVRKQCV